MFSRIGQDEREVLEYVPSSFKVIVHIRSKAELPWLRDDPASAYAVAADLARAARSKA